FVAAFWGLLCFPSKVSAFTQYSAEVIPFGHEWVTRIAFYELLKPHDFRDPKWHNSWNDDPRNQWNNRRKAQNPNLQKVKRAIRRIFWNDKYWHSFLQRGLDEKVLYETFGVDHRVVFSAIMGVRWVDLSGYNVAIEMESDNDCWSAVNQDAAGVQTHHFLREWNESGPEGGIKAIKRAHADFKRFFVDAVMAYARQGEFDLTTIMDGGLWRAKANVLLPYFLLGRAFHLFQDSFSMEHAIRSEEDDFRSIREVKSYCCTPGSEQHKHDNASILNYTNHDVIWKEHLGNFPLWQNNWELFKPGNMKDLPLVAVEGTKDVWAAFFRAALGNRNNAAKMKTAAQKEADHLIANWLSYSEAGVRNWYKDSSHRDHTYVGPNGEGFNSCREVAHFKKPTLAAHIAALKKEQNKCIYNTEPVIGYDAVYDDHLMLPLVWRYKGSVHPYSVAPLSFAAPPNNYEPKAPAQREHQKVRNIEISYKGVTLCVKRDVDLEKLLDVTNWRNYTKNEAPVHWRRPGDDWVKLELEMIGENDKFYLRVKHDPRYFLVPTSVTGTVILWPDSEGFAYTLSQPSSYGGKWSIKAKDLDPVQHFKREAGWDSEKKVFVEKEQADSWDNYKWDVKIWNR
ncbi:MAG: hypothetical protein AAF570_10610, partial [Bacteroidota bacterium]